MPKRKKNGVAAFENFFKKYQYTITSLGIIFSVATSAAAFYFSYNANQLSNEQFALSKKLSFSFTYKRNESTNALAGANFFPLKGNIHLNNIELNFWKDFDEDSIMRVDGPDLFFIPIETKLKDYWDIGGEEACDCPFSPVVDETEVPLIITFKYIETGESKNYSALYQLKVKSYNWSEIRIKGLYFDHEVDPNVRYKSTYIDDYDLLISRRSSAFADFRIDSCLTQVDATKVLQKFIFSKSIYSCPDSNKTEFIMIPFKDSVNHSEFLRDLNLIYANRSTFNHVVQKQIIRIDSFARINRCWKGIKSSKIDYKVAESKLNDLFGQIELELFLVFGKEYSEFIKYYYNTHPRTIAAI